MADYIKPGTNFIEGTEYSADAKILHIYQSDGTAVNDQVYYSFSGWGSHTIHTAFFIRRKKNIVLDFNGAVLRLHGRIQPFIIDECENVTIKNVTVEYARSPFTELRIEDVSNGYMRLKTLQNFPCRVENGLLIPYGEDWENKDLNKGNMFMQAFDSSSGEGRGLLVCVIGENIEESTTPPAFVHKYNVSGEKDEVILKGNFPEYWDSSMTVALAHEGRDISSVQICRSENIHIENYRILNGQGMGILGMYSKDIYISGLKLTRDEFSHGIVTNGADAVHIVASKGVVDIRDSIFEGMIDDALNVHTVYLEVEKIAGNVLRLLCHPERHMIRADFKLLDAGDEIIVHRKNTMEEKGTVTVRDYSVPDADHIDIKVSSTEGIEKGDYVENSSTQPELTISNSVFKKANSHLRIQTGGKSGIFDCDISLPLMLTGDTNYWQEASRVNDLTIKDCRFRGDRGYIRICPEFNITDKAPYYHKNISLIGCSFERKCILEAYAADNITVSKCRVSDGTDPEFSMTKCGTISVTN